MSNKQVSQRRKRMCRCQRCKQVHQDQQREQELQDQLRKKEFRDHQYAKFGLWNKVDQSPEAFHTGSHTTQTVEALSDGTTRYRWSTNYFGKTELVEEEIRGADGRLLSKWVVWAGEFITARFVPSEPKMRGRPCMVETIFRHHNKTTSTSYVLAGDYVLEDGEMWAYSECVTDDGLCVAVEREYADRVSLWEIESRYADPVMSTTYFCVDVDYTKWRPILRRRTVRRSVWLPRPPRCMCMICAAVCPDT